MSELKATTVYDAYWKANSVGEGTGIQVYLKSEADKVIAELKKACNDKDDWCLHTLKENRHQKYKRCLAMASYWGLVSVLVHGETQLKCMRRELKWRKLAEKFKEANDGND